MKAYCLTLDKRISNFGKICQDALDLGIEVQPFICGEGHLDLKYDHIDQNVTPPVYDKSTWYQSWWDKPNAYNAWLCHKKMINLALESGEKEVLFLEDDIRFEYDFERIWGDTKQVLDKMQWDMIYLGWYSNGNLVDEKIHPNIFRMNGGGGFHGVLIKRHMLKYMKELPAYGPLDWCMGQVHSQFSCYAIYPSIINQEDGFSYIEGHHLTKPDRFHK